MAIATSAPLYQPYKFSVEQYHRMAEVGILGEDDRVELIDGEIITMSPVGLRHVACVDRLAQILVLSIARRAIIRVRGSIRFGDQTEPAPDLILLKFRADFYAKSAATAADVFTIIEVMDTSAAYDCGVKLPLYAREGIAELWLVDLNQERVQVNRSPLSGVYTESHLRLRGQSVSPEAFPDLVIGVDDILGPAGE